MNVKCWGPTAWYTLHRITAHYPIQPTPDDKKIHFELFSNLRYTLPCKHCRNSYKIYFSELDIRQFLGTRDHLMYWLYDIHNRVNEKLRSQGYLDTKNPSFSEVHKRYTSKYRECCCPCLLNTLNCIAFNYHNSGTKSGPSPTEKSRVSKLLENFRFTLPCSDCRRRYNLFMNQNPPRLESKGSLVRWSYKLTNELRKNAKCHKKGEITYDSFCDYYKSQMSGCSVNSCRLE